MNGTTAERLGAGGDSPDQPAEMVSTRFPMPDFEPPLPPHVLHAAPAVVTPSSAETHGFGAVLKRRDFRYLWAAQAASQLADKFLMFTLLIYVYSISGHASAQSLLMIAYTLPSVFLSAAAGVYADRHDKRQLMLYCNVLRAGLIFLIPLMAFIPALRDHTWPLIVITFLFSAAGQVFAPAEAASIPSLVSREQIMTATSLFMTTVILTLVLGVPLATLSIKLLGQKAPFYVAAALFIVAAINIWGIRTSLRAEQTSATPAPNVLRELREGLSILRRSPALRLALIQLTVALVVVFTLFALGPAFMTTVLSLSPDDTYIVLIPATLGMVATAAFLGQHALTISRARLLVAALFGVGAALTAIGVIPRMLIAIHMTGAVIPVTIVLAAAFGCALACLLIPAFTVLQEQTTPETRGRIFGGIFMVINAAVALPLLLAGALTDLFGRADVPLAGLGVLLLATAVACRGPLRQRLAVLEGSTFG